MTPQGSGSEADRILNQFTGDSVWKKQKATIDLHAYAKRLETELGTLSSRLEVAEHALHKVRNFDDFEDHYDDPGMVAKEYFEALLGKGE